MPCRTSRDSVRPKPAVNRKPPIASAIASFSARVRDVDARERLRALERGGLGEVDDVDRRLAGRAAAPRASRAAASCAYEKYSGTGPLGVADHGRRPAGAPGQVLREARRRRRASPTSAGTAPAAAPAAAPARPSPGRVGVVVELVHHDLADVGARPPRAGPWLARTSAVQQMIGASGFTAASPVSMPTLSAPNDVDEREELLRHQRLDRRGVERPPPLGQRGEVRADRDQALARAGRRRQDHVGAREELDQGLLLSRVQLEALLGAPRLEGLVQASGSGLPGSRAVSEPAAVAAVPLTDVLRGSWRQPAARVAALPLRLRGVRPEARSTPSNRRIVRLNER